MTYRTYIEEQMTTLAFENVSLKMNVMKLEAEMKAIREARQVPSVSDVCANNSTRTVSENELEKLFEKWATNAVTPTASYYDDLTLSRIAYEAGFKAALERVNNG